MKILLVKIEVEGTGAKFHYLCDRTDLWVDISYQEGHRLLVSTNTGWIPDASVRDAICTTRRILDLLTQEKLVPDSSWLDN